MKKIKRELLSFGFFDSVGLGLLFMQVLQETFNLKLIGDVEEDMNAMLSE